MKSFTQLSSGETKCLFLAIPHTITNPKNYSNFALTIRKSNINKVQIFCHIYFFMLFLQL